MRSIATADLDSDGSAGSREPSDLKPWGRRRRSPRSPRRRRPARPRSRRPVTAPSTSTSTCRRPRRDLDAIPSQISRAHDPAMIEALSINLLQRRPQEVAFGSGVVAFKKRAPRAVRVVRQFATKAMMTKDVRIDTKLNKFLWSNGVRNVPRRVRVRLSRKRSEDEDAKDAMFTLVQHVPVESFKNLQTETVQDE
ncbi:unnamed protein product [Effrenium voratum]|nr:unnamed protein product [Effrenium voratum]